MMKEKGRLFVSLKQYFLLNFRVGDTEFSTIPDTVYNTMQLLTL